MALNRFHVRRAAAAMLRMAQSTSDTVLAAKLIDLAANLKEQACELPVIEAPDLQPKRRNKAATGWRNMKTAPVWGTPRPPTSWGRFTLQRGLVCRMPNKQSAAQDQIAERHPPIDRR